MSYLITTGVHYTKTCKSNSKENYHIYIYTNDKCGRTCYNEAEVHLTENEFIAFYESKYFKDYSLKI